MHDKPVTAYTPSVSYPADAAFEAKGWRSFFSYRDLGVKAATGNDYDIRIVRAGTGDHESTGWHYHVLTVQVVYCLGGWEVIALEDGRVIKLIPGTCLNIPPGFVHNEIGYGPDMEMFVMSSPGAVTTVPVGAPAGWDQEAVMGRLAEETAPTRIGTPWVWAEHRS